jgi:tetratricopeptide (TPR) repeat protein
MIVKDEAHCIKECLLSVAAFCDEMIVVDTGSTDGTEGIAESMGAKVLHFPWIDDFSAARNFGLAAAAGDWILTLDADERLENGEVFLREIRDPKIEGLNVRMTSAREDGTDINWLLLRAFRNRPQNRFENRIHEQAVHTVAKSMKQYGTRLLASKTVIRHIGYLAEVTDQKAKDERNLRIFAKALEDDPRNHYMICKYVECLLKVGDLERARRELDRGYEIIRSLDPKDLKLSATAPDICARLANALFKEGKIEEAREAAEWGRKATVSSLRLETVIGDLEMARGDFDGAAAAYRRALNYEKSDRIDAATVQSVRLFPRLGLVRALLGGEKPDEALKVSAEAYGLLPQDSHSVRSHADVLFRKGDIGQAIKVLNDYLKTHTDDGAAWYDLGNLLFRTRHYPQAMNCLARAEKAFENPKPAKLVQGECLLNMGRMPDARAVFECYPEEPVSQAAILLIEEIASGISNTAPPSDPAVQREWRRIRENLIKTVN